MFMVVGGLLVSIYVIVIYWSMHLNYVFQPLPRKRWLFLYPFVEHNIYSVIFRKSLRMFLLTALLFKFDHWWIAILTYLFNIIGYFEGEFKSNYRRSKITMNNNSIMSLVLYLPFPFLSLISFLRGPEQGGRKFSRGITQETALPQEEKWSE